MKTNKTAVGRICAILLLLCMIFSFAACKNRNAATADTSNPKDGNAETAEAENSGIVVGDPDTSGVAVVSDEDEEEELEPVPDSVVVLPVTQDSGKGTSKNEKPQTTDPSREEAGEALDYAAYVEMSAEEQYAYYKTFGDPEAFLNWYNAAKDQYEKEHPVEVINPGDVIDINE